LVFAPIVTPEDHAQRLPAADLFLDTVPYSAGATASQTLRAGVPILALYGSTYVGRMSTSLLHAVGLPELVCTDLAQYEDRAVQLATDSAAYRAIRQRVRAGAQRLPPAARFARDLERAFERMWATWAAGRKPGPIALNP
jgi:predicted O-linked N-acetylglucosamine transferase (SPINDLY family)